MIHIIQNSQKAAITQQEKLNFTTRIDKESDSDHNPM